jgi:ACS family hexuronate transporter-like MFS transporter
VPWIAINYGWQMAFIITGAIGFIWLVFWLLIYRKPEDDPKLSQAELAYIRSIRPNQLLKFLGRGFFRTGKHGLSRSENF